VGRIIALTGLAGSGKSTVAEMIGGPTVAFAEPLKRFCGEVFGFTTEELYGPSEARERPSTAFTRPTGEPLTARFALQTLGTEWGRNCDPDVWAKAGVACALRLAAIEETAVQPCPVVITDLRFVNEARLVRKAGGEVWRVDRPGLTRGNHPSELDIWSSDMDALVSREISNTGTLEQLAEQVKAALAPYKPWLPSAPQPTGF
jgi:hypothetical protein